MIRRLSHTVTSAEDGDTVGHIARGALHLTRHTVSRAKYLDDGITLDGMRVFTNRIVHAGQVVEVVIGDSETDIAASNVEPCAGPLDIVYEDEDLVVIDKAAGITMYPGPGHFSDTVGARLMAHFEEEGVSCVFHPVHRLDKGTTGLVVIAKSPSAQHRLTRDLHSDRFSRRYLACCDGVPDPTVGIVDAPIAPSADHRRWQVDACGKRAITRYETLVAGDVSLISLELETGRTHQIRVHMSYLGCPLTGDALYGTADESITRPALHSCHIELYHPMTDRRLVFDSPLPDDMGALIGAAGGISGSKTSA